MVRYALVVVSTMVLSVSLARAHAGPAFAQEQEVTFRVERLTENTYCLFGRGGNIGVVDTPEGILVVDDQFENIAEGIVAEIRKVSSRPIRFLVNTHYHGDHTGGNPVFGKFALIVAHDNVRKRLLEQPGILLQEAPAQIEAIDRLIAESSGASEKFLGFLQGKKRFLENRLSGSRDFDPAKAAPPVLTYSHGVKVHLGDEEVRVFHFRRGHTDGDSVVYFPRQKVLHMGDLFFHGSFPFIDRAGGGSAGEWVETLDAVLAMVPADVRIIPGHGEVATRDDLKYFRDYLADLKTEVSKAVKSGKSLREAIDSIAMEKYERIQPGFMRLEYNVDAVYEEVAAGE